MSVLRALALALATMLGACTPQEAPEPRPSLLPALGNISDDPAPRGPERDLWIASADGEAIRIDHRSGRIVARVPVGAFPLDIVIAEGSVWVPSRDDATITRIDTRRNRVVATIRVGTRPTSIAAGEGSVWVLDGLDDTLSRIDPATNRVAMTADVGEGSWDVAAGEGAVWVAGPGRVSRLDPETGAVTGSYEQESFRGFLPNLAVGNGAVWVTDTSTSLLWRIDPATDVFDYREVMSAYPSNRAVAVSDDAIWVATLSDIVRLDLADHRITARLDIRGAHLAIGRKIVWIGDEGTDTLFKLDRPTGRILQRIRLDDIHAIALG